MNKIKIFIIFGLLVPIHSKVLAEITKAAFKEGENYSVQKWEVVDIIFRQKVNHLSPFTMDFGATFKDRSGQQIDVPGFYNGNNEWVLRFSSSIEGQWNFETYADLPKLVGKKAAIDVLKNTAVDNHGAIVVNKQNPQSFSYEDGNPYFLLAFECDWLYALDYNNEKALPKTEHLLNLMEGNGFNQVVMNVFSYDVKWEKDKKLALNPEHEYGGPKNIFPFLGNNDNPDFSALNPEFFQKFDRTISLMHDKRIVAHLMIYVWNKLVNWPGMNTAADNMYFDYVVKRYQAFPNVVWDISKEALYYGRADADYILERIDRVRELDNYQRLLSVHDYGFCLKYPDKVDFVSTQDWSHNLYDKMLAARKEYPNKPIFNIEHGGYEESPYKVFTGDYTDPEVCLRRNYMCLFAGSYTTYYWQGTSWNIVIHNPFEQPDEFIKPHFDYFQFMADLFKRFDYSEFKPQPQMNSSGYNLTNGEGTVLLYAPKENYELSAGFLNNEDRSVQWFNTLTGEYTEVKTMVDAGNLSSPWKSVADAILISKVMN